MPNNDPTLKIRRFRGVNNTEDVADLSVDPDTGAVWLTDALNVDLTDALKARRRPGFAAVASGSVTAAYATADEKALYLVKDGDLLRVDSVDPFATLALAAGLPGGELYWCEAGNFVIYAGAASGMIHLDERLPFGIETPMSPGLTAISGDLPAGRYLVACLYRDAWGREGGCTGFAEIELAQQGGIQIDAPALADHDTLIYASTVNGDQLYLLAETAGGGYNWFSGHPTAFPLDHAQINTYPPPAGDVVAFYESRVWISEYDPAAHVSYIHGSEPFWYHLFRLDNYLPIPGRVRTMKASTSEMGEMLVIGTESGVYAWDGERLTQIADYGVVPGQPAIAYGGQVWLWTERGLCRALPFRNLTDEAYSVPPGKRAAMGLREHDGRRMIVVCTDTSGRANNPKT